MPRIHFSNRQGQQLTGTVELPPGGEWRATALFAHCFTCGRNLKAARNITRTLAAAGYAVLRFDFTGLGESEGDFADTSFSSNLDDLEDAAQWLTEHLDAPQLLVGHSLGGTACLAVAERLPSVRAIATLAAPASPAHVLKQMETDLTAIEQDGEAEVTLAGRSFRIRNDFVHDAREHELAPRLRRLRRALLVLHSPVDNIVGIDQAQAIFAAALHPKSFMSLDDTDHLLSDPADADYAAGIIASWAGRFLSFREPVAEGTVRVTGRTADGFLCRVQAGQHGVLADEPRSSGGTDQGPDPYQYLASALAACTVMTLNMYARKKKLTLERVSCTVEHQKLHARDCEACETSSGKIDVFTRRIQLEGDLDESQRTRLLEIADRCPVHRTLESEIRIQSQLER